MQEAISKYLNTSKQFFGGANDFNLDDLDIDESTDYSDRVIENEEQVEVDNDCGDACKL